jgi:hypothetical protein
VRKLLVVVSVISAALVAGWFFLLRDWWEAERKTAAAREEFAFQSLEGRIPKGKPITLAKPLTTAAAKRLDAQEVRFESAFKERATLLQALHERTRRFFVQARGAGAERGLITDEDVLLNWGTRTSLVEQPGPPADFPLSAGDQLTTVAPEDDHHEHHGFASFLFLNPAGFGFIKNRRQVAGFEPHAFRGQPGQQSAGTRMKIDHVQLVGILMLEQPVVYLTDGLPSMEQVRQGKTRGLDPFEEAGLRSLREGEDLFVAVKGTTVRMLGALRATKQCLHCHDANRGDLLGALSYTLRPRPPEPD